MFHPTTSRNAIRFGFIVAVIFISFAVVTNAVSCKKLMTSIAKKQFKLFRQCAGELKQLFPNKDDQAERINCILKCVMDKGGLLDAKSQKLTNATLKSFMDGNVPDEFHELGFTITEHCIEEFAEKMDPKEELCTSYGTIIKCLQDTVADYAEFCT